MTLRGVRGSSMALWVLLAAFIFSCNERLIPVYGQVQAQGEYRHHGPALLNDPRVTPGAVRTTDVQQICKGGSTKQFRNTTQAMKDEVYKLYGVERNKGVCTGGCEVDHLVSLELGGADDVSNLWPQPSQPKPGFHEKDKLENALHVMVCRGKLSPQVAQAEISEDWYAEYVKIFGESDSSKDVNSRPDTGRARGDRAR